VRGKISLLALLAASAATARAVAGPPFLTDDPVPAPYHGYEAYALIDADKNAGSSTTTQGPAIEFNWGPLHNVQLSVTVPYTFLSVPANPAPPLPQGIPGTTVSGFGDIEFGLKYRFLQKTAGRPQIAFYPSVELPTGNFGDGIGNGRAWWRFPVWLQKSWGDWTTYGGGGYAVNRAPGQSNFPFAGWLMQRDLGGESLVGAELYYQGPQFAGDRWSTFYNVGSEIGLSKEFSILFSIGHTVSGDNQTVGYFALGWTGRFHKGASGTEPAP
jgi:hypothetical protein